MVRSIATNSQLCSMEDISMGIKVAGRRPALLLVLAAISIPAALLINHNVPRPYMDEEFHIRQAQRFCIGDFGYWDPMITTFPGLYIVSLAYARALLPVGQLLGFIPTVDYLCQPEMLRSVNLVFFFICALLFREITLHLDPEKNRIRASAKALVLSLYPLHWFFTFLYYTELGSAAAVMAMYLAALKHFYWSSALFGAFSILLRQTNAVWVVFVLCVGVLDFLQNTMDQRKKLEPQDGSNTDEHMSGQEDETSGKEFHMKSVQGSMRKRLSVRGFIPTPEAIPIRIVPSFVYEGICSEVWTLMTRAWFRKVTVLWNFSPFLLVLLGFIGFVLWNGSIVVGDKSSHKVSAHFAQLLYFGLVSAGFQVAVHFNPQNLGKLLGVLQTSSKKKCFICLILALSAAFIAVHYSSAHPYLLADNRHYTFYFWKDVLQRHWSVKYLLIPLYLFSWCLIIFMLGHTKEVLWVVAFCLAVVGVLVPAPLLEFRYYNVPFYFLFLHSSIPIYCERYTLVLTGLQFVVVNVVTVYIFSYRPFVWPSEPGSFQRFIW